MKITPDEMNRVLEYVSETPPTEKSTAKYAVLYAIWDAFSNLPEEEQKEFPIEIVIRLQYEERRMTFYHLVEEGWVDSVKSLFEDFLEITVHRNDPPYMRAAYAQLAALVCYYILLNTAKDAQNDLDLWIYRGLEAADLAIDLFMRLEEFEDAYDTLDTKTRILTFKSKKEAAQCALRGVRFAPDEDTRKKFAELWREINDERFDMFFDSKDKEFFNDLPLPKETIEELVAEDELISRLAGKCMCSLDPDYDRSPLLLVEKIEDVAIPEVGELAEDAREVFLINRIPPELKFDDGHPIPNVLYVVDDEDDTHYHEYQETEEG